MKSYFPQSINKVLRISKENVFVLADLIPTHHLSRQCVLNKLWHLSLFKLPTTNYCDAWHRLTKVYLSKSLSGDFITSHFLRPSEWHTGWKVGERENNSGSMRLTNPYLKPEPQNSHCSLALNHVWRSLKHFPSAYGLNSVSATANQENDPSLKRRCVACPSKYMVMNNVCLDGAITRPLRAVKSARIAVNSPSQFCLLTVHHRGRWWPLPERNSIPSRSSGLKFSFLSALSQIQTYETIPASNRLMTHK